MAPNLEPPVTPSKRRLNVDEFDLWFLEFSNTYNLNLRRSPTNVSPQKKKALPFYSELRYYELLKVQYFRGRHTEIQFLFDQGAQQIHSKWVRKPNADIDLTPRPRNLPRATSEPERQQLIELLRAIIDDNSSTDISSRSSLYDEPLSPTRRRRRSKRHSDDSEESSASKKTRSSPSEIDTECDPDDYERPESVLSTLDRGQIYSRSTSSEGRNKQRNGRKYESTKSLNTSEITTDSRVFSDRGDHKPFPETQTTIPASSQESLKLPFMQLSHPLGPNSDPLAPSSSTERALKISFDYHEQNNENLQQDVRELLKEKPPAYSECSRPSEQEIRGSYDIPSPTLASPSISPVPSPIKEKIGSMPPRVIDTTSQGFGERLHNVWPALPAHYEHAPFVVRWEILRVALHCGVSTDDLRLEYDPSFTDQKALWTRLQALPVFRGKSFPEKSRPDAWTAALNDKFGTIDQVVTLSASLTVNTSKSGPLFILRLNPLKMDLPHRLSRRFASDRFLELVIPSLASQDMKNLGESALDNIQKWLVNDTHVLLSRVWTPFFIKPSLPKKINNENTLGPQVKTIHQERVYLFAEDGNDFHRLATGDRWSPKGEPANMHTKMGRESLIDWLLQVPNNQSQSILKLFSRIALGLSRTHPTAVVQPDQIRHIPQDILSPTGQVMNDGIARMSHGLARAITNAMGLQDLPAGFQGRFGSAKGFWIRDTSDTGDEIWIETYPSQRKWKCDYVEEDHRTFEVRNEPWELKSANLNLQLLPILEDRAIDRSRMKDQIGKFMKESLKRELDAQKAAMQNPTQSRLWVHENAPSSRRAEHVKVNEVPFTGGLPSGREDIMSFLLVSGFETTKLTFLRDMAWKLRKAKCEELQEKLNVRVGRSTYAYMVVDFLGILEEDEVHLGFSSKFTDEGSEFSETFLHGMDVLVARTPAHYPSDIQRVKAVFKPELGFLKDVIIFSTKGNTPLADKLSGGDYDGDIAWVCWDPTIVGNFSNAEVPDVPNLFDGGVVNKETTTYLELMKLMGESDITSKFLERAFRFNMQQNLLGMCTNYKERLCYARNSVRDNAAILLSTLISHLVDRAKQGIVFTDQDWARLRKTLRRTDPPDPRYKKESWSEIWDPTHIIDHVKFSVGKPTVEEELRVFNESLGHTEHWDEDLVKFYRHYEKLQRPLSERKVAVKKSTWETVLDELKKDIDAFAQKWPKARGDWEAKITNMYDEWQKISPTTKINSSKTIRSFQQEDQVNVGLSNWHLLKASFFFAMYYRKYPSFVWYIAGRQLAHLKAQCVTGRAGGFPVLMIPNMYAGSRPDKKYAQALAARDEGRNLVEGDAIGEKEATSLSDSEF
ncbi:RNA dependent RNA polymerase-domain-containing protein [Hypoxylon trugodes]|uniref:RNA dependent RNA polymerase-domain-containing protein n=1 Tax=Hypoxylon trugodes TaxID=326681 RepID=UPI002190536B|nr:RNA dependent RNA polymerase-domain-containing protein [Hypoxylon trugodes]KAI1393789.1 RNA dependent RNA polymerase-domain-containing protein [Hypoxylon trugodes]